jgi:general secretion pathway protein A
MYENYWNLTCSPFKNTPDLNFFYFSPQHEEAMTRMFYTLIEGRGAMLLTGECGCGKTLIARLFYRELRNRRDKYSLVLIDNPNLNHQELLREILFQLGQATHNLDKMELLQLLSSFLFENYTQGKKTIILVDEAQQIQSKATLEELRLLLNHHHDHDYLLTLFLLGQPEFNDVVAQFPQLDQRISTRFNLLPFSLKEVESYIQYRLKFAESRKNVFNEQAIKAIYDASRGIPRIINHLCDSALLKGFSLSKEFIDKDLILQVIKSESLVS